MLARGELASFIIIIVCTPRTAVLLPVSAWCRLVARGELASFIIISFIIIIVCTLRTAVRQPDSAGDPTATSGNIGVISPDSS
jgi:hypothetical protein